MEDLLKSAKGGKLRKGQKNLINYLQGQRLTRNQAIQAKCYDCDGMGDSGVCEVERCSLYPYSPFRSKSLRGAVL